MSSCDNDMGVADGWEEVYGSIIRIEKPSLLTDLGPILEEGYKTIKSTYHPTDDFTLKLSSIRLDGTNFFLKSQIAAITLRKLQLLFAIATTSTETVTDILVGLLLEISRAVCQLDSSAYDDSLTGQSPLGRLVAALGECGTVVMDLTTGGEYAILF